MSGGCQDSVRVECQSVRPGLWVHGVFFFPRKPTRTHPRVNVNSLNLNNIIRRAQLHKNRQRTRNSRKTATGRRARRMAERRNGEPRERGAASPHGVGRAGHGAGDGARLPTK